MALYHTHRPQRFDAVIGQEHIITTITNQITGNNIAHAYLFAGPRGVGKTTTARLIAKAINVPHNEKTGEPDNNHPDAKAIAAGKSIDVIEIDAASHTGVDHVREHIIENAQFRPTTLKYKVFIIDEVHMLSTSAFNALLKTIEEPPAHVIFILATTEVHKIPATIISRCQRYTFRKVGSTRIVNHLDSIAKEEGVTIANEVLARIAHKSDGCVRDAISLLEQVLSIGKKNINAKDVDKILPSLGAEEAFLYLEQIINSQETACMMQLQSLVEQGTNMGYFMDEVIDMARLLMISTIGNLPGQVDPALINKLNSLSMQTTSAKSLHLLNVLLKYRRLLKQSPIPQLPLEMAVIELLSGVDTTAVNNHPVQTVTPKLKATPEPTVPEEKTTEKILPKPVSKTTGNITKSDVEKKWKQFIADMETRSPALLIILKVAQVHSVTNSTVTLSVEHEFHKEKLLDTSCKLKVEDAFETTLGQKITLDVIIEKNDPTKDNDINNLATTFGGTVM